MKNLLLRSAPFHLLLVGVLGLLVYSNTFHVPFIFDDVRFITTNPTVQDLQYFKNPALVRDLSILPELKHAFRTRILGHLSFALNFRYNGLDVTGYHVVNFAIHLLIALLVYWLVRLTFRTPYFLTRPAGAGDFDIRNHRHAIALFSALLFVCHPIHTQAVTYITQRFASLVAFFYVLSVASYVASRLASSLTARYVGYGVALVSAILAMLTKENAFTLPAVIGLYEVLFFTGAIRKRIAGLVPFFLTMAIIPLSLMAASAGGLGESMRKLAISHDVSRWEYLVTQFRVIVTYLRLLVWPVDQNLYYDYPLYRSFFIPSVVLSFLFLASLGTASLYALRRSMDRASSYGTGLRLLAFGMFWFFITLSMESSIIPIKDVIFEHRLYLPSVGLFVAFLAGVYLLLDRLRVPSAMAARWVPAILTVLVVVFSMTAHARNRVWGNEVSLWEDVVRKSPGMAYNHTELALAYEKYGRTDEAIREYLIAKDLAPTFVMSHNNLGLIYMARGRTDDAIKEYLAAIQMTPEYYNSYINLGIAYAQTGRLQEAVQEYLKAIEIRPSFAITYYNLGLVYSELGRLEEAVESYRNAILRQPDFREAHYSLGVAYKALGRIEEAYREFQESGD